MLTLSPLKNVATAVLLLSISAYTGAQSPSTANSTNTAIPNSTIILKPTDTHQYTAPENVAKQLGVVFLDKAQSIEQLSHQDVYFDVFSRFDWQSKFQSDRKLSPQEIKDYYANNAVVDWQPEWQEKVLNAVKLLKRKTAGMNLNAPKTLKFIVTNGAIESGAAYTREDYIVLPTDYFSASQKEMNHLVAHEFFHVYSRYNIANRSKLYATIGFRRVKPVELPPVLADLKITNPDAPIMNYAIDLNYQNETLTFVPYFHSTMDYINGLDVPFFEFYIQDSLIAIERKSKGASKPLMRNNKPLVVDRSETNYNDKVHPNSDYVINPEEILAENFSHWVVNDPLTYQAPVDRLLKVMREIR